MLLQPLQWLWRRGGIGYAIALASTLVAACIRWAAGPYMGSEAPYLFFYVPVAISAILGGLGPGLVALLLGFGLGSWFFATPQDSLVVSLPSDRALMIVFLVTGSLISVLGMWVSWARQQIYEQGWRTSRLLERMTEAYLSTTPDWTIIDLNREAERLLRTNRRKLIGKNLWETFPEADIFRQQMERALKEGIFTRFEEYCPNLDTWFCASIYPSEDGLAAFFQDITHRRKNEEALRYSEEQFRAFFELVAVGTGLVDPDSGRFLRVNDRYCEITGYSQDELYRMAVLDLIYPPDRELCRQEIERLTRGHARYIDFERRHIRKDGQIAWARVSAGLLRDESGAPIRIVAVIEDITERVQAEQALRISEERFRLAMESARLIAWDYNPETDQLSWNNPDQPWDRESRVTVKLEQFLKLLHPEDRPRIREAARAALNPEGSGEYIEQHRIRRPNGEWRWISARGRVLFSDHDRQPIRSIGVSIDITTIKQVELNLQEAKRIAEEANAAKDRFLAVLSHELRTPLTPVLATASMLENDMQLGLDLRENMHVICRNVELEARLIDDLLDVTRISQGKLELLKRPVRLDEVIQQAIEVCKPDFDTRRLHLGVNLEPAACWIEADAARLQQVFWNLLKNAVKFTPPGGCVGVNARLEGEHGVVVEITDSGIGIEPDALVRIFNAFEQGNRKSSQQLGGLGLGLAIGKALIELHGGTIQAESPGRDQGSTFRVHLPRCMPSSDILADKTPLEQAERPPPASRLRILLVEDHGDTVQILRRILNLYGHEVETAGDIATALQLTETSSFDLLISDLGLPDGSGIDLIRRLRERGQALPAIALSGFGQEEDVHRSREAGFHEHLVKPVDFRHFRQVINRYAQADYQSPTLPSV